MEPFTVLTGIAAPLMLENIDTDVITPMQQMMDRARGTSMAEIAFHPLRFREDGSENPDFVLNREPYRHARILLAGANFGCGSSRESAVTAIKGLGIRCVIAPSFGDIFFNNCFQNSVLPIRLDEATVAALAREASADGFTVDLETLKITTPSGRAIPFEVDPTRREALLKGLDDIGMTLEHEEEIAAFQARDRRARPWIYMA